MDDCMFCEIDACVSAIVDRNRDNPEAAAAEFRDYVTALDRTARAEYKALFGRELDEQGTTHIYLLDPGRRVGGLSKHFRGVRAFDTLDHAKAAMQAHFTEPIEWHSSNQEEFCGAFYNDSNWPDVQISRVEVEH